MLVTDAQVHIWEANRPDRPWASGRIQPHGSGPLTAEQLMPQMDATGVDRAVLIPPSWVGENNATCLEAAADHPSRFAVMGRFDPKSPDARDQLQTWLSEPGMLGIRLTFLRESASWLDDGTLEWFWPECERLGIPLMVFPTGQLPKLESIAKRHPSLRLIVDHMGRESTAHGPEAFADFDELLALAPLSNISVKVTSVPNFSDEEYPFQDIHPYLRRVYDAFGPRRMMWGSDLTRLKGSYSQCLALFRDELGFSDDDLEWILGRAAAETLRWPESGA